MLASASTDHTVLLWDLDEAGSASSVDTLNLDTSNISIALSPNGKSVAVPARMNPEQLSQMRPTTPCAYGNVRHSRNRGLFAGNLASFLSLPRPKE